MRLRYKKSKKQNNRRIQGRSEDSKDEHMHLSDAVLESVMVFRLAAGAVAEVVVSLGLAKAGFLSGCTVVLGIVAATEERSEDA